MSSGDDKWNGAGDRGDGAMIAYGAARYALCLFAVLKLLITPLIIERVKEKIDVKITSGNRTILNKKFKDGETINIQLP